VSRRVNLPGADELFGAKEEAAPASDPTLRLDRGTGTPTSGPARTLTAVPAGGIAPAPTVEPKGSSGRVRHDEKITVYMSADELLDLEHARLTLRRDYGVAVDRGRIVREALDVALAEVAAIGRASPLVRRLVGDVMLVDVDMTSAEEPSRGPADSNSAAGSSRTEPE
jgi:hypothetical protein